MHSITTNGAAALLLALALTVAVMPRAIYWLRRLKAEQSIREDAPRAHQAKAGTPTMGGVVIVAAAATATILFAGLDVLVGPALALTLAFAGIGFLDDLLIARRGKNLGLRAREKLVLQVIFALLFVVLVRMAVPPILVHSISWFGLEPLARALAAPLGLLAPALAVDAAPIIHTTLGVLFLVGLANAVNLTDGLDGLASGLVVIAGVAAALLLPPALQSSLGILPLALAGACLGFLWFNCNPARVFMGDTGSLALGGGLGAFAVITRTELLFLVLGAVFWAEMLSVMIQVVVFKRTGRRVFRMSPIHHHFELSGWKEPQIVSRFWIVGAAAAALALLLA